MGGRPGGTGLWKLRKELAVGGGGRCQRIQMLRAGCGEDAKQAFEFVIRRSSELYQNYRESLLLRCWGQRANSFHGSRIVSAGTENNEGDEITRTPFKDRKYLSTFID